MTGVKIMDGGCNYEVGEVLNVTGTATTTGHSVLVQSQYKILITILVILLVYAGVTSESHSSEV